MIKDHSNCFLSYDEIQNIIKKLIRDIGKVGGKLEKLETIPDIQLTDFTLAYEAYKITCKDFIKIGNLYNVFYA